LNCDTLQGTNQTGHAQICNHGRFLPWFYVDPLYNSIVSVVLLSWIVIVSQSVSYV